MRQASHCVAFDAGGNDILRVSGVVSRHLPPSRSGGSRPPVGQVPGDYLSCPCQQRFTHAQATKARTGRP
jgi:hypothetical protein